MACNLFAKIAPRYDLANRVMSGGMDVLWRRSVASELDPQPGDRVLDLCTGTGDLGRSLFHHSGGRAIVHGADFSHPMLLVSRSKLREAREPVRLCTADGLQLPYRDGSFDISVASFGVRSFADLGRGIGEMSRVVRRGGKVAILEFSVPPSPFFRGIYMVYLKYVLPRIGDLVSGSPGTYDYLPSTILDFPSPDRLADLMTQQDLQGVRYRHLTFGVATLHVGVRR